MIGRGVTDYAIGETVNRCTLLRRVTEGVFAGCEIWACRDCTAPAESPVPWDTSRVWPWVVVIMSLVTDRRTGALIQVSFTMPCDDGPGSDAWRIAELACVKRLGIHEAMESFGPDPHTSGGDTRITLPTCIER